MSTQPIITIASPGAGKKGRSFSATLLCFAVCDRLRSTGDVKNNTRPIFLEFICAENTYRAFSMNLRMGEVAVREHPTVRYQLLKSEGYTWAPPQKSQGYVRQAVYLGYLYDRDPGSVDHQTVRLAIQPPMGSNYATYLHAALETRTRSPLLSDPAFKIFLFDELLKREVAFVIKSEYMATAGYMDPIGIFCSQATIENHLSEIIRSYYERD